ncbi:unnamed protein product [marine sediment metagenome]|uniref:DUF35 domain-containing protein n=1 Tax=marine sediment metagenome TaxID=412755 RepID=X1GXP4_9ZZZZ
MTESKNKSEGVKKVIPFDSKMLRLGDASETPPLLGSRCKSCGKVYFPPRIICPECFTNDTMEEVSLSKRGKLYSFTIIRRQSLCPPNFTAPYAFGYVDLPEGVRVVSLLQGDIDSLTLDSEMELVLRKLGEDESGNEIMAFSFVTVRDPELGCF